MFNTSELIIYFCMVLFMFHHLSIFSIGPHFTKSSAKPGQGSASKLDLMALMYDQTRREADEGDRQGPKEVAYGGGGSQWS